MRFFSDLHTNRWLASEIILISLTHLRLIGYNNLGRFFLLLLLPMKQTRFPCWSESSWENHFPIFFLMRLSCRLYEDKWRIRGRKRRKKRTKEKNHYRYIIKLNKFTIIHHSRDEMRRGKDAVNCKR